MLHSTSALDGPLFLVRHLLVLREVPDRFGLGGKTETGTEKLGVSAFGGGSMRGQAGFGTSTSGSSGSLAESISLSSILGGRPAALLTSLGLGLGEGDGLGAGDGKRTIENAKRVSVFSVRKRSPIYLLHRQLINPYDKHASVSFLP